MTVLGQLVLVRISTRLVFVALAVGLASTCVARITYFYPEATLYVVDGRGEPIEGTHVLVTWEVIEPGLSEARRYSRITSGVTDDEGRVVFRSAGPQILAFRSLAPEQPTIFAFRPGYRPVAVANAKAKHSFQQQLDLNLGTDSIEMELAASINERYYRDLDEFTSLLVMLAAAQTCEASNAENFVEALRAEKKRVAAVLDLHPLFDFVLRDPATCQS